MMRRELATIRGLVRGRPKHPARGLFPVSPSKRRRSTRRAHGRRADGFGFSLPSLGVPLIPLFVTVACSTVAFTLTGLAFGNALGNRYRLGAEHACGLILIVLALLFTLQHVRN
jgi:hypothetical protein